jgi:Ca2+-transporting ATPase
MTTIHTNEDKQFAYMKGAPEMVIERCSKIALNGKIVPFTKEKQAKHFQVTESLAKQALRNLAFAYKELPNGVEFTESMEQTLSLSA